MQLSTISYTLAILILLNVVKQCKGQFTSVEGLQCETPRNDYGTCLNIKQCPILLDLIRTQSENATVIRYLHSSLCGYKGKLPIVCCPRVEPMNSNGENEKIHNNNNIQHIKYELPLVPNCGLTNVTATRVVNGIPAKLGEFPWIVALGYRNSKNPNQPRWLCGGTMITGLHILTAAHCVHNRNDLYLARLGDLNLYSDNDGATISTIPLESAKIHENYNTKTYTNDIAILKLSTAHENPTVRPICMPLQEPLLTRNLTRHQGFVAGWGALYFRGPSSTSLQLAALPIVDNYDCGRAYANVSIINENVLCAGFLNGGTDACSGDSGGPLMYAQRLNRQFAFYQIGVVSYGFRCAEAGYPGVYTRITSYINWIQSNLF